MARQGQIVVRFERKGSFANSIALLKKLSTERFKMHLDDYGRRGVEALRQATPKRTGLTSESWGYEIVDNLDSTGQLTLSWYNTNVDKIGRPIVVLIQYGHATRNGGFVEGIDFINPAMKPIFEEIANGIWKEVVSTRG